MDDKRFFYIFDLDDTLYQLNDTKGKKTLINCIHPELLCGLNGYKIIFTNSNGNYSVKLLEKLNILNNINLILSADILGGLKPQNNIYKKIEQICNINNETDVIYFFDNHEFNLFPAKKIGWITILINPNAKKKSSYVDFTFNNINEAIKYITQ